jgi:putative transcriptional regulator
MGVRTCIVAGKEVNIQIVSQPFDRGLDTLLAGYAAGTLSAPLRVLVASHLALAPRSRWFVSQLEDAAASSLEDARPVPVSSRDEKLAAIFAEPADGRARHVDADETIPMPLAQYLGMPLADIPWRTKLPGLKEYHVEDSEHGEASLYWIKAGRTIPSHTHDGSEITLVLRGSFYDPTGHYRRGDIAIADNELDHHPTAGEDEDCICFAVTDAPLRLTGPVGRIVQKLIGH